jgi:hypothetical protein
VRDDPRWAGLARRLIGHEAGARTDPASTAAALERACQRLKDRLVPLIGPDGFRIMLANAVDVTRADHPFLQAIDSRADLNGCFHELSEAMRGCTGEAALAGAVRVLSAFLGLLGSFVGDALTERLVRGAWPDIPWAAKRGREPGTGG